jgi:hypothetical protein
MSTAPKPSGGRLDPILQHVARNLGRYGIKEGAPGGPAVLRIIREEGVKRVVQVYWTPFQIDMQSSVVGLHLEVAEPRVHWAECYASPNERSWVLCFFEPPEGDIQLAYHRDYATGEDAVDGFFKLSAWYVLTATGKDWADVQYTVDSGLSWDDGLRATAGASKSAAIQESLKKSTIVWLRWNDSGIERTMPVWYVFDNKTNRIYVLSGERQQTLPGAERMRECDVIFRQKGKNVRVAELPASVRVLEPGPEWDEVAEKIAEKRLNIPGVPEDTAKRWRDQCVILELTLRI